MTNKDKKLLSDYNFPPEKEAALLERIDFVEQVLAPLLTDKEIQKVKNEYMEKTGCSERTIRNYIKRYKQNDSIGLILYDLKKTREPFYSQEIEDKVVSLIKENPRRSTPKIREILLRTDAFHEEALHISERQFYRIAKKNGLDKKGKNLLLDDVKRSYRSFEAPHSMALVQGDARDGIWIDCPDGKKRKNYLFAWIDDYSRKILYAEYYWNEKLPCMEDSFRKMVLRYGIPEKIYLDNGAVYISNHFNFVIRDLDIKKIHHPPYKANCKGKVEAVMKKIKNDFQNEAQYAGFQTIEELNSAFHAWVDVKYDKQALSTTGEAPGKRFVEGITVNPKRIENLDEFMQYFLFRETRTVNKYGRIKLKGNSYPVKKIYHGTVVHIRYDPFDLRKVFIYDNNRVLVETTEPSTLKNTSDPNIPEEGKEPSNKIKESARNYFTTLRKLHLESQKKSMPNLEYEKLFVSDSLKMSKEDDNE